MYRSYGASTKLYRLCKFQKVLQNPTRTSRKQNEEKSDNKIISETLINKGL